MNIQDRPRSEKRKHQKPVVLTSTTLGELSVNRYERKGNCKIVLSDKQEKCLKIIYRRMLNEADYLIAHGFHNESLDFTMNHLTRCFRN